MHPAMESNQGHKQVSPMVISCELSTRTGSRWCHRWRRQDRRGSPQQTRWASPSSAGMVPTLPLSTPSGSLPPQCCSPLQTDAAHPCNRKNILSFYSGRQQEQTANNSREACSDPVLPLLHGMPEINHLQVHLLAQSYAGVRVQTAGFVGPDNLTKYSTAAHIICSVPCVILQQARIHHTIDCSPG